MVGVGRWGSRRRGREGAVSYTHLDVYKRQEPVHKYLDFMKPFIPSTDGSAYATGTVLSQIHNGQEYPVAMQVDN